MSNRIVVLRPKFSNVPSLTALLVSLLGLTAAGCSEANPLGRQAISGTVQFDGKPLDHGTIEFSPLNPDGVSSGTTIEAGAYQIAARQGVPPGEYKVRIMSPTDAEATDAEEEPAAPSAPPCPDNAASGPRQPPPAKERIPSSYNTKSDVVIEVTASGKQQFDFDIPATAP